MGLRSPQGSERRLKLILHWFVGWRQLNRTDMEWFASKAVAEMAADVLKKQKQTLKCTLLTK